ncbi:MAG: methyltransferase domain-containing protein [Alphaproteobacteria bacterium]|nr:methyltransferase domain-containing protein [Alphaproteobacteria bacterium]
MAQLFGDDPQQWVRTYYGDILKTSDDLRTDACCAAPPPGWLRSLLQNVHPEVQRRFYGCGSPIPEALSGRRVVDLGCGTGRDAFVLAQLVGPEGAVIGVDMTEAQLALPRSLRDWHVERMGAQAPATLDFRHGFIEDLAGVGLEPGSVDLFVSNCVVNLSPRKDLVLQQVHEALVEGGEFYLSDVVADRRLPTELARDPLLYGECLGGAMYRHDLEDLCKRVGFLDPRVIEVQPIAIRDAEVQRRVGAARFFSVSYRLLKLPGLEPRCEDYGQVATYLGGVPHHEGLFVLDDHHYFEAGRPERVCGNTAAMLSRTRLAPWFRVDGDTERHFGLFDCGPTMAALPYQGQPGSGSGSCC